METITTTNAHGKFTASGYAVDRAIREYLPASVNDLREALADVAGYMPEHYADVHTVAELLVMIADADPDEGGPSLARTAHIAHHAAAEARDVAAEARDALARSAHAEPWQCPRCRSLFERGPGFDHEPCRTSIAADQAEALTAEALNFVGLGRAARLGAESLEGRIADALAAAATPEQLAEAERLNITPEQRAERRRAGHRAQPIRIMTRKDRK